MGGPVVPDSVIVTLIQVLFHKLIRLWKLNIYMTKNQQFQSNEHKLLDDIKQQYVCKLNIYYYVV